MASKNHLDIFRKGPAVWNKWRAEHPEIMPDLSEANLIGDSYIDEEGNLVHEIPLYGNINLTGYNFSKANLQQACLVGANQSHLKWLLSSYFDYYHHDRTHYGLGKDTPFERPVQSKPSQGSKVIELPRVGGLHHHYEWKKAA